jgi:hypothetical protein
MTNFKAQISNQIQSSNVKLFDFGFWIFYRPCLCGKKIKGRNLVELT